MLVGLSDLLRHTLDHSSRHEVELREEINFIKLYLSIQEMRFSDRLRIDFDIDPATTRALVPNLILQPLTENALRHGIGRLRVVYPCASPSRCACHTRSIA